MLIFQAASGLVANDDIAFEGPLYALVDKETSERLSGLLAPPPAATMPAW